MTWKDRLKKIESNIIDVRNPSFEIKKQMAGQNPNVAPSYGSGVQVSGDNVSFQSIDGRHTYNMNLSRLEDLVADYTNGKADSAKLSNDTTGWRGLVAELDLGRIHHSGKLQSSGRLEDKQIQADAQKLRQMQTAGSRNYGG